MSQDEEMAVEESGPAEEDGLVLHKLVLTRAQWEQWETTLTARADPVEALVKLFMEPRL